MVGIGPGGVEFVIGERNESGAEARKKPPQAEWLICALGTGGFARWAAIENNETTQNQMPRSTFSWSRAIRFCSECNLDKGAKRE
jgi:hypothetical protein